MTKQFPVTAYYLLIAFLLRSLRSCKLILKNIKGTKRRLLFESRNYPEWQWIRKGEVIKCPINCSEHFPDKDTELDYKGENYWLWETRVPAWQHSTIKITFYSVRDLENYSRVQNSKGIWCLCYMIYIIVIWNSKN